MGLYIPNMEMPTSCAFCKIKRRNGRKMVCPLCDYEWDIHDPMSADFRLQNCPLIEVPEPHGDLIDRDAFVKELEYDIELAQRALDGMECVGKDREILLLDKICKDNSIQYLSEAPVVIPASKEKET